MNLVSEQAAAHFASPLLKGDSELAHFMMSEYARALAEIAGTAPQILDQLGEPSDNPLPWPAFWNPSLAHLERVLAKSTDPRTIDKAIAPLLIDFAAAGAIHEASLPLDPTAPLYWGGVRLPSSERLSFQSSDNRAVLELDKADGRKDTLIIARTSDGLWASGQNGTVPVVWFGRFPMRLHADPDHRIYPLPQSQQPAQFAAGDVKETFARAADLIGKYAPGFLPWIGASIGSIVALDASKGARMSATVEEFPGLVYLSLPAEPLELAARLVHEASHQHFYALQRLTQLHDGSDTNEYYSPIKGRSRPIELILFAFHAFGNGLLFHRALPSNDDRFRSILGETVESMQGQLGELHQHLGETKALTEMGRAMWLPIAERLFD